ncbi:MAG: hypothetical protein ACR2PL_16270 [Dehalococcoidia bacterium]
MIFSLILAGGAFALIAWLIFNLSAYALPFFVGLTAAFYAHGSGAGLVGSGVVGLIAGALTFAFGQIAFSMARSTMARGLVAAVFAVPATGAGYYSTSGIVELCIPGHGWRLAFSLVGAVVTGAVAYMRLAAFAPPRVERGGAEDFIAAHAGTDANR